MVVRANIVKKQTIGVDLNQKAGGFSAPVQSVNSKTGDVILNANDVGALPDTTFIPSKVSELENDEGFLKSYTESDPTVPAWAKEPTKPKYTAKEVGALSADTEIPSKLSDLKNDSGFLTSVPDEYITETELDAKGYLTSVPSEYVTETELNAKGYLTQHQDLSGYAKKATTLEGYGITDAASKQELNSYGKVKTVNYMTPDANGNINVEGGSGKESNAFELIKSDTLVWNGNDDGKIIATNTIDPSLWYVCVSDVIPTLTELQKGGIWTTVDVKGREYSEPFTSSNIVESGNLINCCDGYILVAKADGVRYTEGSDIDCTLPKAGVYFAYFGADGYVSRLSVTDYTGFTKSILKMESLTLHQHDWYGKAVVGGNTVRGDETLQGKWVKVSDEVPTEAEINNGGVVRYYNVTDDVISDELITGYYPSDDYVVTVKDEGITIRYGMEFLVIISFNGSSSIGGVTFKGIDSPGVYFKQVGQSCVHSFTINGYTKFSYNVEKIPFELIPDGIGSGEGSSVADWDTMINKPFYEKIVNYGNIFSFDGNTDGLYNVMGMYYHVCSCTPTLEELQKGGSVTISENGEVIEEQFTADNVMPIDLMGGGANINIVGVEQGMFIVAYDGAYIEEDGVILQFEKTGIYVMPTPCTITINNYEFIARELKQIESKYIPPAEPQTFIINTEGSYRDLTLTLDKTLAEIVAAYNKGYMCFVNYNDRLIPMKKASAMGSFGQFSFEDYNFSASTANRFGVLTIEVSNLNENFTTEIVVTEKEVEVPTELFNRYKQN